MELEPVGHGVYSNYQNGTMLPRPCFGDLPTHAPSAPFPIGGLLCFVVQASPFCFGKLSRRQLLALLTGTLERSQQTHMESSQQAPSAVSRQVKIWGQLRERLGWDGGLRLASWGRQDPGGAGEGADVRPQVLEQGFSWLLSSWSFHIGRATIKPQTDCPGGG